MQAGAMGCTRLLVLLSGSFIGLCVLINHARSKAGRGGKGRSEKISGVQQRKSLSLKELLVLTLVVSLMEKFNHFQ